MRDISGSLVGASRKRLPRQQRIETHTLLRVGEVGRVGNDYRDNSGLKRARSPTVSRQTSLVGNDYRDNSGLKPARSSFLITFCPCRKRLPRQQRIETVGGCLDLSRDLDVGNDYRDNSGLKQDATSHQLTQCRVQSETTTATTAD